MFVSHGAPSIAVEEDDYTRTLARFGERLAHARAIAVVSAHWQAPAPMRVNAVARPEPIYDFGGFSPELYTMRYDAPGDPELAREIASLLGATLETSRGWDHGLWVPMHVMLGAHPLPTVEISLPFGATPHDLLDAGRRLAPLRERGVVIAGSGGIVHNLRMLNMGSKHAAPEPWAAEFDERIAEWIRTRDFDAIAAYREKAPNARLAAPTPEHFDPLFVTLGAMREDDEIETVFAGFHYGTLSLRTIATPAVLS
jgi:4,5-DOPA dioxygenase extradiol